MAYPQRYVGETKNQLREGFGVYNYSNRFFKYEGEWHKGKKHGHGKLLMTDGSYFEGEFKEGEIQGNGSKYWATTDNHYSGHFDKGELDGFGVMHYGDGSVYEGEWSNNLREGNGVLVDADGSTYRGSFHDHKRHGEGRQVNGNGEEYEGDWVNGLRHGHGIMKFEDGSIYGGQWRSNDFHGQGAFIHCSGCSYEGIWRSGRPELEATKLEVVGPLVIEIAQGDLIHFEVQCVTNDGDVPPETGRYLQVCAGEKTKAARSKESSAKHHVSKEDLLEEIQEEERVATFHTPFDFEATPYPLLEIPMRNLDPFDKQQETSVESTENQELPVNVVIDEAQDAPEVIKVDSNNQETTLASKETNKKTTDDDNDMVMGRFFPNNNTINPQHETNNSPRITKSNPDLTFVTPVHVVDGRASFEGVFLPPMSSVQILGRSSPDSNEIKSNSPGKSKRLDVNQANTRATPAVDKRKGEEFLHSDPDKTSEKSFKDKKKKEKKEEKVEKEEKKYCRPGDYVLVIQDVTHPPFLDAQLEPAYLHVKVVQRSKRSRPKTETKR